MSSSAGQGEQQLQGRGNRPLGRKFKPKVKTGCRTCRIRRVKCDEGRPACHRCLSTDRVCDGYPSVFRVLAVGASPASTSAPTASSGSSLSLYQPKSSIVTADDINKLVHYFHRKRPAGVSYQNEARAVLGNLSDPAIRHALNSLKDLHDGVANVERSLSEYNAAVSILASRLRGEHSRASAQCALVSCLMFISIEVMIGDYTTAFQHLHQGLRIMYQYRNRPSASDDGDGRVFPCRNPDFPHLDAFAIKLFASGYRGPHATPAPQGATMGPVTVTTAANASLCDQARSDLCALSAQVLDFLSRVTDLRNHSQVPVLRVSKAQILGCLQSWETMYSKTVQGVMRGTADFNVRFGTAFALLLHRVLKVAVSLAMTASTVALDALEKDFHTLDEIASFATKIREAEMNGTKRN